MMGSKTDTRRNRVRIVLASALVVMFLLLIALGVFFVQVLKPPTAVNAGPASADGSLTWVRSLYGYGPSAAEQLAGPAAVTTAPDGTIYSTDPGHRRVMAFAPDGTFRRLIGATMDRGKLVKPLGISCDSRGNVYVSDIQAQRIVVYSPAGRYLRDWNVKNVMGIGVDGERVYALVGGGGVVTFTLTGQKLSAWGSTGRRADQLAAVYGITPRGTSVYIADSNNNGVKSFTPTGRLQWVRGQVRGAIDTSASMEASAAAGDEIQIPQASAVDAAGRVVVVDAFSFKLVVLDPKDGKVLATYGEPGTGDGQFMYATGVAYDPARDWFAVADTMNNRVQIVRIPGSGGGMASAARRALSSPFRICAVPLILLLIAVGILATWRRRDRAEEPVVTETAENADLMVEGS